MAGIRSHSSSLSLDGEKRETDPLLPSPPTNGFRKPPQCRPEDKQDDCKSSSPNPTLIFIYGMINVIMTVPCMYGYTAVIFNNDAFRPHIDALSKLVLFSSVVHQIVFSIFSSLPFSIGQVQDAGLIFLSAMSNTIADTILEAGGDTKDVVSTTVVLLGLGTSTLGVVLFVMGKFKLADVVSFLPLPVVGGYLAFIGYFCLEAGVGMCIGETIMELKDWSHLNNTKNVILATPGILAGVLMTWTSRTATSDAALPFVMVLVPALFYAVVFVSGMGMDGAREEGWIGEESPPVSVMDVFNLIDFRRVKWSLIKDCMGTWVGMVFVVSFASCLDVAAISTDMGEPLNTNQELKTVGLSNFFSGLFGGFTGSYIFSQTIFTYRSGMWTRWIGVIVALTELAVFLMKTNVLQVTPLFFLGSTLIFIAVDLVYEWLIEVRHKLLLSEYLVLLLTFVAIQVFGIQSGIVIGIIVAGVDYIVTTAQTSSVRTVKKRSRAVWNQTEWHLLQDHGYNHSNPKIVSFELKGSVFFGSSLKLLTQMLDRIGLNELSTQPEEIDNLKNLIASPRHVRSKFSSPRHVKSGFKSPSMNRKSSDSPPAIRMSQPPSFIVLDMTEMTNLDASAARGCFLQLAKMCGKKRITICASGGNRKVYWTLRSHEVAYGEDEVDVVKDRLLKGVGSENVGDGSDAKIMLFDRQNEALEFCESALLFNLESALVVNLKTTMRRNLSDGSLSARALMMDGNDNKGETATLSSILNQYVKLDYADMKLVNNVLRTPGKYYKQITLRSGETIFAENTKQNAFYVILKGKVSVYLSEHSSECHRPQNKDILTGAGPVSTNSMAPSSSHQGHRMEILTLGSIFGYCDFILEQNCTFGARVLEDQTVLAEFDRMGMGCLKKETLATLRIVERVMLQASVRELNNARDL